MSSNHASKLNASPNIPPAPTPPPTPTAPEVSQAPATAMDGYDARKTKARGRSTTILRGPRGV